jgi:hypothetical protein
MTQFTFTIEQIREIYEAGVRRGSDEATSYDWGVSPDGNKFDELVEVMSNIVNEGKTFTDDDYTHWDDVEKIVKE